MHHLTEKSLKTEWLETIHTFSKEYDFPPKAAEVLDDSMARVIQCEKAWDIFSAYDHSYDRDVHLDYDKMRSELDSVSSVCGVHAYTLHLLFFMGLSRKTRKLYEEKGISSRIFHDSMSDLRWKLTECYKMYGIWGSFVAPWFDGWFTVTRFALGRLQFELLPFPDTYRGNHLSLNPGDTVINVHIPSCGPLIRSEYLKSYDMAAEFFRDVFPGQSVIPFFCDSWMLFPDHEKFLPPSSHILEFKRDYDVFHTETSEEDLWRIFYGQAKNKPEALPSDTSLQRAYRSWLMAGNTVGTGMGVFPYKSGSIQ